MRKYTTFGCFSSHSRPSTIVATAAAFLANKRNIYKAEEQHKKLKQTQNRLLSEKVFVSAASRGWTSKTNNESEKEKRENYNRKIGYKNNI